MKIEPIDFWKNRDCNECHSQDKVRELYLGENIIALCRDCRKKLQEVLILNEKVDKLDDELMSDLLND